MGGVVKESTVRSILANITFGKSLAQSEIAQDKNEKMLHDGLSISSAVGAKRFAHGLPDADTVSYAAFIDRSRFTLGLESPASAVG